MSVWVCGYGCEWVYGCAWIGLCMCVWVHGCGCGCIHGCADMGVLWLYEEVYVHTVCGCVDMGVCVDMVMWVREYKCMGVCIWV